MQSNKAQVTIFIIIGILLLATIGTVVYVQNQSQDIRAPTLIKAPADALPVQDFITSCLTETSKEAIKSIGDYGGYISAATVPGNKNPVQPTESDAVLLGGPDSDLAVPYWWYMRSSNTCHSSCEFGTNKPDLTTIQTQLQNYINEHIEQCFDNFNALKQQGFEIITPNTPQTKTTLKEKTTSIQLTYPVTVNKGDTTHKLSDTYYVEHDIPLRKIYDIATRLTNLQIQYNYLEKPMTNTIDLYGGRDANSLPPTSDMTFSFGPGHTWARYDVQNKVTALTQQYIPFLQVFPSRNYKYIPAPAGTKDRKLFELLYNRDFIIPYENDTDVLDYNIRYTYLDWWTPYFNINCDGQLCSPTAFQNSFIFLFGIQQYNFAYDLSYPVLVEIQDPDAFGGEGFRFNMFLEANIRNNQPVTSQGIQLAIPEQLAAASTENIYCAASQRTSPEVTLKVTEQSSGQPITNAVVNYICGDNTCGLGKTTNGTLTTALPDNCLGGYLHAIAEGHSARAQRFDTAGLERQTTVQLELNKYHPINFTVKKYNLRKNWKEAPWDVSFTNGAEALRKDEQAIVTLVRVPDGIEDETFAATLTYNGGYNADNTAAQDINLIPGKYVIDMTVIKWPDEPIIIPPDRRCEDGGTFHSDTCYNVPETAMVFNATNSLVTSMMKLNWTLHARDLEQSNHITLKALTQEYNTFAPENNIIEDLSVVNTINDYVTAYAVFFTPEVSRK